MNSLKAFLAMGAWTIAIFVFLYLIGAHLNYRDPIWAISIAIVLLITHMVNMFLYFRITGNKPYLWFK